MRNETTLNALTSELQRNCGDTLAAARAVGVSLMFVNQWAKDDKEVAEKLAEASRVGAQGLVSAAIQRAVHGTTKGVYYRGVKVDEEVVYSDGLLQTLLKAKIPEFAADRENSSVQVNVNVANLMPRASSYDEWLTMKAQTLAKSQDALPAPDRDLEALCHDGVIEAEYVEVQPVFAGIDL